jgi:hypothetical protein
MKTHFKTCPSCSQVWALREMFLEDADIEIIGYQVNFEQLMLGLFLFNHHTCKTTMAVQARQFRDLDAGPVYSQRKTGRTECPGYCLNTPELAPCPAECECAWVRRLLQVIREWPKTVEISRAADG